MTDPEVFTKATPQDRVQRGANFLDEKFPGWYKKVRLPVTARIMASGSGPKRGCVACQVIGSDYEDAMEQMGILRSSSDSENGDVAHGFMIETFNPNDRWGPLAQAWTEQVECRLENYKESNT